MAQYTRSFLFMCCLCVPIGSAATLLIPYEHAIECHHLPHRHSFQCIFVHNCFTLHAKRAMPGADVTEAILSHHACDISMQCGFIRGRNLRSCGNRTQVATIVDLPKNASPPAYLRLSTGAKVRICAKVGCAFSHSCT